MKLKIKLAKACLSPLNKYKIEVADMSDKNIDAIDKREMLKLKIILGCHKHSGNTFLRQMCN